MAAEKLTPLTLSPDATTTYAEWKSWKRSLLYFLEAKDITDDGRKKATLLHYGGRDLQEIYETLETADPGGAKAAKDQFEYAVKALDKHFEPTTNKFHERYKFRQIRQGSSSLDQFVVQLRKQAANCSYVNVNDAIIDQIIEGTADVSFREKILEKRLSKLSDVIELGKLLESVRTQTTDFSGEHSRREETVARVSIDKQRNSQSLSNQRRCYRCKSSSHIGSDETCPARQATCLRCNKVGHFANCCRSRSAATSSDTKNSASTSSADKVPAKTKQLETPKVQALNLESPSSDEDPGCWALRTAPKIRKYSNRVPLRFDNISVNPVIDSAADPNLIAPNHWQQLKRAGLKYTSLPFDSSVYLYGKKFTLSFQEAVRFVVHSKSASLEADFLIVAPDGGFYETIVGRDLAIDLGVLKIDEDVSAINQLSLDPAVTARKGKLIGEQVSVRTDPSVKPVAQPCRKVPLALRKMIKEHSSELLEDDIIERVQNEPTPWVSPIVPVIKKDGSLRLCVDMRLANKAVLRENYPIPTFEELVAEMTDCEVFSKIDLRAAYNQVELEEESRKITTFITPDGVFRFKRLYCGIRSAPEIFQRLMTNVIAGLENVRVFFDDLIIFSKTKHDHETHVNALLQRLKDRGLVINLKKCVFAQSEVEFLGHKLSRNTIKPNTTNAAAVRDFKPPTSKKDLQSFLGLMNYVSKFIPNFSTLTEPLRKLLGKQTVFRWSESHSKTFETLKSAVLNVKLAIYDPNARILLYADASPFGLGAVLMQRRLGQSEPEILAFASRSLSKPERNYSQIEREALGLVWACERFCLYTLGKQFDLYTDHKPLEILFGPRSKPNARIERWVLRIQSFDYCIHYIQGPKNLADPFSRLGCQEASKHSYTPNVRSSVLALASMAVPAAISLEEFRQQSSCDEEIVAVIAALQNNTKIPDQFSKVRFELTFAGPLLMRGDRLVPPKNLRQRILEQAHEGHPGVEMMKRRLRTKVWWPRIDFEAEAVVKHCHSCLTVSRVDPPEPMKRSSLPQGPWEYVALDHLGPLPNGKYLLLIVDYFSRFVDHFFVSSTSSTETITCLLKSFAKFGFPTRIKTDNATSFTSDEFSSFLHEYGVLHITSPPLWPRANGEVERQNRSMLKRLRIAAVEKKNLMQELARYLLLYHSTSHSATGVSPAEMMLGRKIRDKLPSINHPSPLYDSVRDRDAEFKMAGKDYADKKRGLTGQRRNFEIGDLVLLPAIKSNKLSPTFNPDPYVVVATSPGEVTVRRGAHTYRRSASAVKLVPKASSINVDGPSMPSTDEDQAELSRPVSPVPVESPTSSPFKGFSASPTVETAGSTTTTDSSSSVVTTRSGRQVRPPDRYSPDPIL